MMYEHAAEYADIMRDKGKKIVFTNGCFDILHVGHLRYLKQAKQQGDILIVGLNSDDSVKRLKGELRPVVGEYERQEMLEGLACVDKVFLFHEDTPIDLIRSVIPDRLVKGGDWPIESIVGHEFVLKNGGEVKSLAFHEGNSTTSIIEKLTEILKKEGEI